MNRMGNRPALLLCKQRGLGILALVVEQVEILEGTGADGEKCEDQQPCGRAAHGGNLGF